MFKSKVPDDDLDTTDLGGDLIEITKTDNIHEKFNKLSVQGDLQVSVLSGLLQLSGSGSYLKEERNSARAQSMSLLCKLRTVEEEIMIRQRKDLIDKDVLEDESLDATHVVFAIDWGAVCYVTCVDENKEDKDVTKVRQTLRLDVEKLKNLVDIKASEEVSYDNKNEESHKNYTFHCFTDVYPPDKELPVTFGGAVDLARNLPKLMKERNNGKGVPLTYTMMPLANVIKMCKLQVQNTVKYTAIDENVVKKCLHDVEEITKTKQTLYDTQNDLQAHADYVDKGSLDKIHEVLQKFLKDESRFQERLQDLVIKVRSCNEDVSVLEKFLDNALSDTVDITWYNDQIKSLQSDINKVKSVKSYKSKGIAYIGKKDDVTIPGETVSSKRNVFIFYKSNEEDQKNEEFFLRLQSTHIQDNDCKFIVIDKDIRKDLWAAGKKKTAIHKFVGGSKKSSDLYDEEGQDLDMCLIEMFAPKYQQVRPKKWAQVKLRCPNALSGSGQCTGDPITWMCSKCKEVVEYGVETKLFYCNCGESDPKMSRFRCSEKDHGLNYINYPDEYLSAELSNLQAVKEKNILILGETGVGKSTWINGIVNYLYFADMKDAISATEFHVLIPSSFTFTQQGKEKKILVGERDGNENMEAGKSATKEPRSYRFFVDGEIIRLIDTPGVGDSEGIQQDEKNFDNILSYLTHYDDIHAVCILLKPNNARLTAMFRFCIQELLAHLHSSAKNNIVFCFTNARATFYQPGDTLPAVNKELDDKNVGIQATPDNYFCFDNEPFRFLACLKNGVKFSQGEISTYSESWNKSVEETKHLFAHISKLTPHQVRNTLSMNEARRIIVAMSKPSAEVARTIQHNVQQGIDAKRQIDMLDESMDSMKDKLKFSGYDIKRTDLEYPMTVCADSKCVEHYNVGESQVQNTVYKQVCHDHCYVGGIEKETINDPRLQGCWCIDGSYCHQCGHHYTTHMHITYNIKVYETEFLSKAVQKEINEKKTAKEQKEAAKRAIDEKNAELEKEKEIIMKTSAKYGSFLKANAIIPYNDAVEDYLDMIIDQERKKTSAFRNDALLQTMERMKTEYGEQRRILDAAIGTNIGENIHSPEEVMKLQEQLFCLKHMGQTLKELFEKISIAQSARNIAFQETTAPTPQRNMNGAAVNSAYKPAVIPDNTNRSKGLMGSVSSILSWRPWRR